MCHYQDKEIEMLSIGLRELFVIGVLCAIPLAAGAITLVMMLARRGKRREANLSIGDEK